MDHFGWKLQFSKLFTTSFQLLKLGIATLNQNINSVSNYMAIMVQKTSHLESENCIKEALLYWKLLLFSLSDVLLVWGTNTYRMLDYTKVYLIYNIIPLIDYLSSIKSTYWGFTTSLLTLQSWNNPPISIQKGVILLQHHLRHTSEVHVVTQLRSVCKALVLSRHINKCSRYHLSHGDSGI